MKLVGISNKIRVLLDWTLDLLIERSITQIGCGSRLPLEKPPSASGAAVTGEDGSSRLPKHAQH